MACSDGHLAYLHSIDENTLSPVNLPLGPLPESFFAFEEIKALSVAERLANLVNLAVSQASWILTRSTIKELESDIVSQEEGRGKRGREEDRKGGMEEEKERGRETERKRGRGREEERQRGREPERKRGREEERREGEEEWKREGRREKGGR